jgi:hypothetical protein
VTSAPPPQVSAPQSAPVRGRLLSWLGVLGVALLFVALRWNTFDAPLVRDEGEYAYAGQLFRQGIAPYEHSFLQKPPMIAYTYALADLVAPGVAWFPRILAYGFAAAATVLLALVARKEFGRGCALPAAWLVTPMLLLPGIDQPTANTEMFLLLPLMGVVAAWSLSRKRGAGTGAWFAAGLLGAIALLYKYTCLPILAVVFITWSRDAWRQTGRRALLHHWSYGFLGGLLGLVAGLGWFVARDGGWHVWECTIQYNRFYTASSSFGFAGFSTWVRKLWGNWWILFLLPLALTVRAPRRAGLWGILFFAAWLTTSFSRYGQYYILLMPFWALLAVAAIHHASQQLAARFAFSEGVLRRAGTAIVVILLCWPDLAVIFRSREQVRRDQPDILSGASMVAGRVAALTSPGDPVFVAGSEPQILSMARRRSPTRFVIMYPLMIPTPVARTYQKEAIRDLEEHPPALIVHIPAGSSWLRSRSTPPDFDQYLDWLLATRYEAAGGYVVRADGGAWREPLPEPERAAACMVVYRPKKRD